MNAKIWDNVQEWGRGGEGVKETQKCPNFKLRILKTERGSLFVKNVYVFMST